LIICRKIAAVHGEIGDGLRVDHSDERRGCRLDRCSRRRNFDDLLLLGNSQLDVEIGHFGNATSTLSIFLASNPALLAVMVVEPHG